MNPLFLFLPVLMGDAPAPTSPDVVYSPVAAAPDRRPDPELFRPRLHLQPPGFPEIWIFSTASSEAVSLRLSVPVEESADEAGAGHLLRRMAEERMDGLAARVGARVQVLRHGTTLSYEVSGAGADLDFLVWILQEGVSEPDFSRFAGFRRDALEEQARRLETPQGLLALQLREALVPGIPPPHGTLTSLERMDASRVQRLWERSHRAGSAHLVVAGNLPTEVIMAALSDLSLAPGSSEGAPPTSAPAGQPRPRSEVIRAWAAEGRLIDGGRDPRAFVAVRLISETVRANRGDYELGVELWEVDRRWALVLSGAAYPRTQQAMRTRLRGLLQETAARVEEESVRRHAAQVVQELLEAAGTPWGLSELIGQALDHGEDPQRLAEFLQELSRLGAEEMRAFLDQLASATPVRQEVSR